MEKHIYIKLGLIVYLGKVILRTTLMYLKMHTHTPAPTYKHVWRQWNSRYHLLLFERILQQSESESKALEVRNGCHQLQRFVLHLYSSLHITENRTAFWLTVHVMNSHSYPTGGSSTHTGKWQSIIEQGNINRFDISDLRHPLERCVTSELLWYRPDATPVVSVSIRHTSLKNRMCHQVLVAWQYKSQGL